MTTGASSIVQAMELYELPKEIPMAQRSSGETPALAALSVIVSACRSAVDFSDGSGSVQEARGQVKMRQALGIRQVDAIVRLLKILVAKEKKASKAIANPCR
jgi:hypothetical protein